MQYAFVRIEKVRTWLAKKFSVPIGVLSRGDPGSTWRADRIMLDQQHWSIKITRILVSVWDV